MRRENGNACHESFQKLAQGTPPSPQRGEGWGEGVRTSEQKLRLPNPLILSFSPISAFTRVFDALWGRRDAACQAQHSSPLMRTPSSRRGEGVASGAVVHQASAIYPASFVQLRLGQMKPAPFDYHAPRQLKEAAELLATLPNAKILAGGQSLVPMMNFRYVVADHLVDLGGIADLRGIAVVDGRLRIGAMMRQRELEIAPEVAQYCPLMAEALRHVGHRQTRNRGTIGGSLAHADPAAELPAVCAAYDAVIHVASIRGIRQVSFQEFSTGFMATALAARRDDRCHRPAGLAAGSWLRLPRIRPPARRFCAGRRRGAARCRRRQCGAPRRTFAVRRRRRAGPGRSRRSAAHWPAARLEP